MTLISLFKYWLLCFVPLTLSNACLANNAIELPSTLVNLTVNLKKIKNTTNPIIIELVKFQHKNVIDWRNSNSIISEKVNLKKMKKEYLFLNISPGFYAIRAYQDINNNQFLDETSSGIPTEPVAFSKNPSLFKGEPSPAKCMLDIDNDTKIDLKFKHRKKRQKKKKR